MRQISGTTIKSFLDNDLNLIVEGSIDNIGAGIPTTASTFAIGCRIVDLSTGVSYINTGSVASPVWTSRDQTVTITSATIATTSNTDAYVIAPETGVLSGVDFSGVDALAASDSNFITWTITNLGQAGAGSTAMLASSPTGINTTKVTGGTAIGANTKYSLTLAAAANLAVTAGDRLRIRAAATGTLANTVTFPVYILRFNTTTK